MRLMGWCTAAPGTKPDAHHRHCRREYVTAAGVPVVCECPAHEDDEESD